MDEHPGDTLGKRFLTFWGALFAIAAVALLLGLYRWVALPSDDEVKDGGAGAARLKLANEVRSAQAKEYANASEVEPGKAVRIPADAAVTYAVSVLKAQKAAPGPIMTMKAQAAKAAQPPTTHDPNLSQFEGATPTTKP